MVLGRPRLEQARGAAPFARCRHSQTRGFSLRVVGWLRALDWLAGSGLGGRNQVVRLVLKYLAPQQASEVQTLLRGKSVKLKYSEYDWTFRGFQLPKSQA